MNPRFRSTLGIKAIAVVVALAIPLIASAELHDLPRPLQVFVEGRSHYVPPTATLAQVVRAYHVHARSGSLLDVDGRILRKDAFPGRILLDGEHAPRWRRLQDRDRIVVVNEPDRREPLARRNVHLSGRRPGDPEFYLGSS